MTNAFRCELENIITYVESAISRILLSDDRTSKHKPYTWMDEDIDQHLLKACRHINTYIQIENGYCKSDGEDHLDNAITRLSMAVAKLAILKYKEKI
jgi:hypothetical protein